MSVLRSVIKLRRIALPREILRKTSQYNGITARGKRPTGPLQKVAKKIKTPEVIAYTSDFPGIPALMAQNTPHTIKTSILFSKMYCWKLHIFTGIQHHKRKGHQTVRTDSLEFVSCHIFAKPHSIRIKLNKEKTLSTQNAESKTIINPDIAHIAKGGCP